MRFDLRRIDSHRLDEISLHAVGPALSPGNLLVNVFGRLIAVLVASAVPLRAGCGRPDVELLFSKDCSCNAFGSFSSVCAVERSISLSTELTSGCSTFG